MKFKDLANNKKFQLQGNTVIYTKKDHGKPTCCTPENNAWTQAVGQQKKTYILVDGESDVEEII